MKGPVVSIEAWGKAYAWSINYTLFGGNYTDVGARNPNAGQCTPIGYPQRRTRALVADGRVDAAAGCGHRGRLLEKSRAAAFLEHQRGIVSRPSA